VFLVFLLSFAQRLAGDDGRFGEAILIGIDDQPLTALNPDLLEDRGQIMGRRRLGDLGSLRPGNPMFSANLDFGDGQPKILFVSSPQLSGSAFHV